MFSPMRTEVILRPSLVVLMSDATSPCHRHVQKVPLDCKVGARYDVRHAPEDPRREVPQCSDDRVTATLSGICNPSSDIIRKWLHTTAKINGASVSDSK